MYYIYKRLFAIIVCVCVWIVENEAFNSGYIGRDDEGYVIMIRLLTFYLYEVALAIELAHTGWVWQLWRVISM